MPYSTIRRLGMQLERSKRGRFVITVLLLPVILSVALIFSPAAFLLDWMRTRRIKRTVCGFICISCGTQLGVEAIRLGNERWAALVSGFQAKQPNSRLKLIRDLQAVCPICSSEYMYRDADRSLVLRPKGALFSKGGITYGFSFS